MKPSEQCKAAGLDGLYELVKITGVSQRTLINWHKNRPKLFKIIIAGVAFSKWQCADLSL